MMIKQPAFTLTEVLLAVAIVGIIAALILPATVSKFNEKTLDLGYEREIKTISGAVDSLVVSENKKDFFSTMMYTDVEPESYYDTSGKFIKKYLKISKYCGDNNGDCFASKYYTYSDNQKKEYTPAYKGSCARLKNGMSICITPQIGARSIERIIDINGSKGPNIFGRDLRSFIINAKTRTGRVTDTTEVLAHNGYIELEQEQPETPDPPPDPCSIDNNSLDCCKTRAISGSTDACCTYDELNKTGSACVKSKEIAELMLGGMGYVYTGRPNPNVPSPLDLIGDNVPKGVTVSYSSNIVSKSVQSDSGTIRDKNSYVMTSGNYPKNMSIRIPEVSYTCSHTFSTAPNKNYCGGGSCLPRLDTRLYFKIEYMIDYANNFAGYTGRVSCFVLGDERVNIRKDF